MNDFLKCLIYQPILAIAAALAILASLVLTAPALAAATFVKSGPLPGSTVGAPIQSVTVIFSEPVTLAGSSIEVRGPDGARVDQGNPRLEPMGRAMIVPLKPHLPIGRYTVRWTSVSAEDGQTRTGSFDFTVAPIVRTVPIPWMDVKWALPDNAVSAVFSERLDPRRSSITVVGPNGVREDQGNSHLDPTGTTLSVSLKPNAPHGEYRATWTAVMATDGQTFSDSFRFTLLQDQRPGLPSSAPPVQPSEPLSVTATVNTLPRSGGWPLGLPIALGIAAIAVGVAARRAFIQADRTENGERNRGG